jgi:hypothetical protein
MDHNEIHVILIAEANRRNLPEAFQKDLLVHDVNRLQETGSQDFLWVLRTCGTDLFTLDDKQKPGEVLRNLFWQKRSQFADEQVHFYHFQDGNLSEVTFEQAQHAALEASPAPRRTLRYDIWQFSK